MRLVNWRSLAIGAAGLGLAACGDDVVVANQGTLTAAPASVTCAPGTTQAIGANLAGGQTGATFTFATANVSPANAFTVTGTGSTATVTCTNVGSGTVTVTSGNQTFNVPVTVSGTAQSPFSVLIAPSNATVAVNGTVTLSGTVLGAGTLPAVRYRSAQPNIATVDSTSGVVTGRAVGVATIIASPAGFPATAAAATVTVVGAGGLVSSIVANPPSVTLSTGQTQQLSAQVNLQTNAPTTTARTVTYTSQNPAIATVSTTGLVTGVANGSTSIIVRSTADTAIFVAVPVTVRAQQAVRVTIANVTTENTNQLVDITQPIGTAAPNTGASGFNNTGSIFVTLNVDPGDATINRVDLFLSPAASPNDTTNRVCSQVFTAALADAYRLALQNGSADVQPITCPINLAAFDTATGNPRIRNGNAVLRARVTGSFAGTGTTGQASQIAQFTQNLQINNQSGFFVRVTNTPDAAQVTNSGNQRGTAQGPDGRNWVAGSLNFAILPISFDTVVSGAPAPREVTVQLSDSGAYGGPLTRTLRVTAAASGPTTVTFPGRPATQPFGVTGGSNALGNVSPRDTASTATGQNLDGVTSGPTGTRVQVSGVGFGSGAALNALSVTLNGATQTLNTGAQNQFVGTFRLNIDNQAPQPASTFAIPAATLTSNFTQLTPPTGPFVGFLGGTMTPATVFAPNFNNTLAGNNAVLGVTGNGDFGGVDRVTTTFFADTVSTLPSFTAANIQTGGIRFVSGSSLPAANANTFYAAAARFVDVLGNARNQIVTQGAATLNAAGQLTAGGTALTFGVDLTRPTLTTTGADSIVNIANQGVAQNNVATQYTDDIGFGGTPLVVIGQRQVRSPDLASATAPQTFCFTGLAAGVATFSASNTNTTGPCEGVPVSGTSTITLSNTANGQYTFAIVARDQAGNVSDTARVRRYVDVTLPTPGSISLPQVLTGNAAVQFTSSASDNLELGTAYPQVSYAAVSPATYGTGAFQLSYAAQSLTTLGRAFDNVFTAINSSITLTVPSFLRSVTFASAAGVPAVPTNANLADSLIAVVTDAAIAPGFQANQTTTIVPIPAGNIPLTGFGPTIFATGNQTSQINSFTLTSSSPTIALTRSGTFTVATAGQIGAFINPLARVELWYSQVGAAAVYQRLALVPSGLTTDNTAAAANVGRVINSTLTFSPTGTALEGGVTSTQSVEYNIIAVGVTQAGDALVSAPVRVTITAAP